MPKSLCHLLVVVLLPRTPTSLFGIWRRPKNKFFNIGGTYGTTTETIWIPGWGWGLVAFGPCAPSIDSELPKRGLLSKAPNWLTSDVLSASGCLSAESSTKFERASSRSSSSNYSSSSSLSRSGLAALGFLEMSTVEEFCCFSSSEVIFVPVPNESICCLLSAFAGFFLGGMIVTSKIYLIYYIVVKTRLINKLAASFRK